MKKIFPLIAITAALSLLSGILMSKMSFLARTSMNIFRKKYQYYEFMRTWWQGALAVFSVLMLFMVIQLLVKKRYPKTVSTVVQAGSLLLAIAGLYLTYHDFRHDLTHRWVGERFHLGFYLFWIGWMIVSIYVWGLAPYKKQPDPDMNVLDPRI